MPAVGRFALLVPEGQGRKLVLYSWGGRGQIRDLARGARDRRRDAAVAEDRPAPLLRSRRLDGRTGDAAAEQNPNGHRLRSPIHFPKQIAAYRLQVPIWWSTPDQIVVDRAHESKVMFDRIVAAHPKAPVEKVVGKWRHSAEMRANTQLPAPSSGSGCSRSGPAYPFRVATSRGSSGWQRETPAAASEKSMQTLAWYDELERIAGNVAKLSPCARSAVRDVVVSILSEGEKYPLRLEGVVTALIAD